MQEQSLSTCDESWLPGPQTTPVLCSSRATQSAKYLAAGHTGLTDKHWPQVAPPANCTEFMATSGRFAAGACLPLQAQAPDDPPEKVPCNSSHPEGAKLACADAVIYTTATYRSREGHCLGGAAQHGQKENDHDEHRHHCGPWPWALRCPPANDPGELSKQEIAAYRDQDVPPSCVHDHLPLDLRACASQGWSTR